MQMNKQLILELVPAFSDFLSPHQMDCVFLDANKMKTGMVKIVFVKPDLLHSMENAPSALEIRLQINLEQAVCAPYLDIFSTLLSSNA